MKSCVKFFSLFVSVSSLLVACGGGSGNSTESESNIPATGQATSNVNENLLPAVTAEMLQGRWGGNCDVADDGSAIGVIAEYSGNEYTVWESLYDDASCSNSIFDIGLLGDFTLGDANYAANGTVVTELDEFSHTVMLRPGDLDFAEFLNDDVFCDSTDWRMGEALDVTDCDGFFDYLDNFSIVQFDGDIHFLGENTEALNGTSSSNRPIDIDYTVSYSKLFNDETSATNQASTGVSRGTDTSMLDFYLEKLKSY